MGCDTEHESVDPLCGSSSRHHLPRRQGRGHSGVAVGQGIDAGALQLSFLPGSPPGRLAAGSDRRWKHFPAAALPIGGLQILHTGLARLSAYFAEHVAVRVPILHTGLARLSAYFEFHGSTVTSDAGLLAYRELDDALGLTSKVASGLLDSRTGHNTQHGLLALLRQSLYSRLAGYEDVNDAERLCRDPAMRTVVGGRAKDNTAASTSEMARFETVANICDDGAEPSLGGGSLVVGVCGKADAKVYNTFGLVLRG